MSVPVLTHFPCLKNQHYEGKDINYLKYSTMIADLAAAFDVRFLDFRDFGIFSNPFQAAPDQSPEQFQLELIDLRSRNNLKSQIEAHERHFG